MERFVYILRMADESGDYYRGVIATSAKEAFVIADNNGHKPMELVNVETLIENEKGIE